MPQKIHRKLSIGLLMLLLGICSSVSFAADTPSTTSTAIDKSAYTLFNPTPADQMRDMDTDRPSHTNTPHTVDAGHVQFEVGIADYVFNRDKFQTDNARSDTFTLGQIAARIGVLNNLEIAAVINGYQFFRMTDFNAATSTRQNSVGDVNLGVKWDLVGDDAEDKPWAAGLGIEAQFKIPTARRDIGNGHFEGTLGIPVVVSLPGEFHLGAETFISKQRNASNTAGEIGWQNSVALDRAVISKLDVYVEYWSSLTRHGQAIQSVDVGASYPLTDSLIVDTGFNFGLNKVTPNLECTAGFSIRF